MAERILSKVREEALVRLLDDDSPIVREGVQAEFTRLGETGLHMLERLASGRNRILASHADALIRVIAGPDPVGEFVEFIRSLHYELETGAILINRTVFPEIDTAECCLMLDRIAARCRELTIRPSSPWERCRVINRVLFHEYGFRGNTEDFDSPLNSLIEPVLRRRKGIPISLSIIYLAVASRCGLELEPIGLPGRFMVGCFLEKRPFYIDPFERGGLRSPEELCEMLRSNNVVPKPGHLAPAPVGEVLCRVCRNLVRQYLVNNNPQRAKLFAGFVHEFENTYRRHAESS